MGQQLSVTPLVLPAGSQDVGRPAARLRMAAGGSGNLGQNTRWFG